MQPHKANSPDKIDISEDIDDYIKSISKPNSV